MAHHQAAQPPARAPGRPSTSQTLLTPGEVAALFRVDPKTVTRLARSGKLASIRTLGGHRRYHESQVRRLLATVPQQTATRSPRLLERGVEDNQLPMVGAPTTDDDQTGPAGP